MVDKKLNYAVVDKTLKEIYRGQRLGMEHSVMVDKINPVGKGIIPRYEVLGTYLDYLFTSLCCRKISKRLKISRT